MPTDAPAPLPASPGGRAAPIARLPPRGQVVDPAAMARQHRRVQALQEPPWLHQEVARRMAERLAVLRRPPQQVLDWDARLGGGGAALRAACPQARIVAVEDAAGLALAAASSARWWSPRAWWAGSRAGDALAAEAVPPGGADLLWCSMGWHYAPDPAALLRQWLQALAVDGVLMFSSFGPDTLRSLRALYAAQGWPPAMAGFVDMHDIGDLVVQAGFADPVMDQEVIRLNWGDAAALLTELRTLGGNDHRERYPGLRTPRWRDRLLRALAALALPSAAAGPARLSLEFEIVYGHAVKPLPRARVDAVTTVGVEDLRHQARATSRRRSD